MAAETNPRKMHFKVTFKKFCVHSQKPNGPKMSNKR